VFGKGKFLSAKSGDYCGCGHEILLLARN